MALLRLVAVLLALAGFCTAQRIVGGWQRKEVGSNPKFLELAHLAASAQTNGREYYDTVTEVIEVYTQVVAGVNYKLKIKTAPSICKIAETEYSKEICRPQANAVETVCTAIVYDVPWRKGTPPTVTSFKCEA